MHKCSMLNQSLTVCFVKNQSLFQRVFLHFISQAIGQITHMLKLYKKSKKCSHDSTIRQVITQLMFHLCGSVIGLATQWWNVTKYIYLSTVIKYKFKVLVHYLSVSILCSFVLLLPYIPEVKIQTFHSSGCFSFLFRSQFFILFLSSENRKS